MMEGCDGDEQWFSAERGHIDRQTWPGDSEVTRDPSLGGSTAHGACEPRYADSLFFLGMPASIETLKIASRDEVGDSFRPRV